MRTHGTHLVHEFVLDQLDGIGVHAALPEVQELVHLIKKITYFIDNVYQQTLNPYLKNNILDQGYFDKASNREQLIIKEIIVIR
jgi:hypothetical protein